MAAATTTTAPTTSAPAEKAPAPVFTGKRKIVKEKGQTPDALEKSVANALYELENNAPELTADLKELFISGARQVDLGKGKSAIVVFVPFRLLRAFHKIQPRLVRELEKKFSGQHIVLIANRRILPKEGKNNRRKRQKRPMSRTLTQVHDAILEDLCHPTEIVGKRIRIRLDGSRLIKVYLDKKDQQTVSYKLETFSQVYKKLTGKDVVFLFPDTPKNN
eukprot:TRINITY_DN14185_c0_g1_i1.p1 TRINITY_DN14185_c0_g1~~TRINITY_DN14185_c0_g1_i1.p1  ORF type:complete len:219 (-),score=48.50 TRINITY_DN14185_c0_g1_i1:69-725(-)